MCSGLCRAERESCPRPQCKSRAARRQARCVSRRTASQRRDRGAAVELAKQKADDGDTVEFKSPQQELADRVEPAKPFSLKQRNGQVLNTTPKARDIANDNDIDLAEEIGYGSGAKGRIVVGDVMKVVNAKKKATEPEPEPEPEPSPSPPSLLLSPSPQSLKWLSSLSPSLKPS